MTPPSETFLLWKLPTPDPSVADDVLCRRFRLALADPRFSGLLRNYYVSRRAEEDGSDLRVELTAFVATEQRASLMQGLNEVLGVSGVEALPDNEILKGDLWWYREGLRTVTDIALEVLDGSHAGTLQTTLRRMPDPCHPHVTLSGEDYRNLLESHLIEGSTRFTALGPPARLDFWIRFPQWPRPPGDPSFLSPSGHWLWNILNVG